MFVTDDKPVRLEAASAFTVCSSVSSTGHLLNGFPVLLMVKPPFFKIERTILLSQSARPPTCILIRRDTLSMLLHFLLCDGFRQLQTYKTMSFTKTCSSLCFHSFFERLQCYTIRGLPPSHMGHAWAKSRYLGHPRVLTSWYPCTVWYISNEWKVILAPLNIYLGI